MSSVMQRVVWSVLVVCMAGCSSVSHSVDGVKSSVEGWFDRNEPGLDTSAIRTPLAEASSEATVRYPATVRISSFRDERKSGRPRLLGMNTQPIFGLDEGPVWLDKDVADLVAVVFRNRFAMAGYQVLEGAGAANAMFDVSGVVKELTLNIKDRDEVTIAIETTVTEIATGKVVWSGVVTEQDDHYAGVFGNSRGDVVAYLNKELQVVSKKTVDAITSSLLALQPALMNPVPAARGMAGVSVNVAAAPASAGAVPAPAPMAQPPAPVVTMPAAVRAPTTAEEPAYVPHATATSGLLLVTTHPARAMVYLDDVYFGMTPIRTEMKPAVSKLTIKLDGYQTITEKISVRRGEKTELELNLKPVH